MKADEKTGLITELLNKTYPEAKIALRYGNTLELLVAVMLSAQCTDTRVNLITEKLFKKYKTVKDYSRAEQSDLEQDIRSAGFFRNKAKNIISAARKIISDHKGKVPQTMEELTALPGVARKTANIVLFNAFGQNQGIAVDTHVRRLSQRLGLTENNDPDKIEQDLMKLVPQKIWGSFTYLLIEHGRAVCKARKPKCGQCVLAELCPSRGRV